EVGFERSAISDRLDTDFTYYRQNVVDGLFSVSQVPSNGFLSSQLVNVGAFQARGAEIALNGDVFRSRSVTWAAGITVALQSSKVTSLGGAPAFSIGNNGWIAEGGPVANVRGRKLKNPDAI